MGDPSRLRSWPNVFRRWGGFFLFTMMKKAANAMTRAAASAERAIVTFTPVDNSGGLDSSSPLRSGSTLASSDGSLMEDCVEVAIKSEVIEGTVKD